MDKLMDSICLLTDEELKEVKKLEKEFEMCKKDKIVAYISYVKYLQLVAKYNGFLNYIDFLNWKHGEK